MTRSPSPTNDDPALDPRVRKLLDTAAAQIETAGRLPGEDQALAVFRATPQSTRRTSMLSPLISAKAAVAAAIGSGVLLTGGVGAAAAGMLPGAAQETASTLLDTVGISVPAGDRADENGDLRGRSEEARVGEAEQPLAADHGRRVSETAKTSTSEGADKGKEIAGVASDGRVESGDRGPSETPQGGEDNGEPPVSAANSGGTGSASDATDGQDRSAGAADDGTSTADEASDGASSAGSGNRSGG
jgi:hypothetical protein